MTTEADSEVSGAGSELHIESVLDRLGLEGKERATAIEFFAACGVDSMSQESTVTLLHQAADVHAGHLSPLDFEVRLAEQFDLDFALLQHKKLLEAVAAALVAGHPGD